MDSAERRLKRCGIQAQACIIMALSAILIGT